MLNPAGNRFTSPTRLLTIGALCVGLCVALVSPVDAQSTTSKAGFQSLQGRGTFRAFCASCHGADAVGDGKLAEYLTVPPADLTRIRERHDGEFPHDMVRDVIDGRKPMRGHGTREMPVWGDVFQAELATDAHRNEEPEERVERKIGELIAFLESIQQPAGESSSADSAE